MSDEEVRNRKRKNKERLSYDCIYLIYKGRGKTVCKLGKRLTTSRDGTLRLDSVLKGYTPKICLYCKEYVGEESSE